LNCPLDRDQYEHFVDELLKADSATAHIPEDHTSYFEACLPIEEIARRGRDTLRFGPMKPMGLDNPRTGRRPWAVVQLRQENLRAGSFNLVGFQNHMKFGDQARVLRLIPGLQNAEFLRFGQIHRNTYINAPALLTPTLQLRARPEIFFAGQISGVEGYVESIATGLMAGMHAAALALGRTPRPLPPTPPPPTPKLTSPPTSPSICCRRSTKPTVYACAATRRLATPSSASTRSTPSNSTWMPTAMPASELQRQIDLYLDDLARSGNSAHSIRAYESDLRQFLAYLSPPDLAPPEPQAIDLLLLREWLASLYGDKLAAVTLRRKLAAVRGLFRFMLREGVVPLNVARLVRTPKAPQKLPEVMSAEQANALLDGVASGKLERPFPARDRALFELLYGCGIRVSELAGLNLEDIDRSAGWLRVRGKGKKERQVPLPGKAAESLERYLGERPVVREE